MASRYDLNSLMGAKEDNERYYDQMVCLSQGIINASIKDHFDRVQGVCGLYLDDPELGQIDAALGAPTFMINGSAMSDGPEIFFQLRIKSGVITFKDKAQRTITDWVLSVYTNPNAISNIRAGEYRAQAVLALLGSADWQSPNQILSTCWDSKTQKTIRFQQWAADEDNARYATTALRLISRWAGMQKSENISTAGIRYNLGDNQVKQKSPFGAVHRHTEVYPFVAKGGKYTNVGGNEKIDQAQPDGYFQDGNYNCLLFCENVNVAPVVEQAVGAVDARRLPDDPKHRMIKHIANMAEPPLEIGDPDIRGSYVLDHRILWPRVILPQLNQFCLSMFVGFKPPACSWNDKRRAMVFNHHHTIGENLASLPVPDWIRNDRKEGMNYSWSRPAIKRSSIGTPQPIYRVSGLPYTITGYTDHEFEASHEVSVRWEPGFPFLTVEGTIVYRYWFRFAANEGMTENKQQKWFVTKTNWSFKLKLEDKEDGKLHLVVHGSPVYGNEIVNDAPDPAVKGNTLKVVSGDLKDAFDRAMSALTSNLEKYASTAECFMYPAHRVLAFKDPRFTRLGGLVTQVTYDNPSGNDGTIVFPKVLRKQTSTGPLSDLAPETRFAGQALGHKGEPALTWSINLKYDPESQRGTLTLVALNKTTALVSFASIMVTLPASTAAANEGERLFLSDDWYRNDLQVQAGSAKDQDGKSTYSFKAIDQSNKTCRPEDLGAPQVTLKAKVDRLELSISPARSVGGAAKAFSIPKNKGFTVELQGAVPMLGQYVVEISESWTRSRVQGLERGSYAMDYKMVEIRMGEDGKAACTTWDVSDRIKEDQARARATSV